MVLESHASSSNQGSLVTPAEPAANAGAYSGESRFAALPPPPPPRRPFSNLFGSAREIPLRRDTAYGALVGSLGNFLQITHSGEPPTAERPLHFSIPHPDVLAASTAPPHLLAPNKPGRADE